MLETTCFQRPLLWYNNPSKPLPKQALVFTCLQNKSFENTVRKGEIARNKQFVLFPQCFLPIWKMFYHFHPVWNSHLQTLSVWKRLKFSILKTTCCNRPLSFLPLSGLWIQVILYIMWEFLAQAFNMRCPTFFHIDIKHTWMFCRNCPAILQDKTRSQLTP